MRILSVVALALLVGCAAEEAPPERPPAPSAAPAPPPPPAPAPEPAKDFASMTPEEQQAHLMKLGEEVYKTGGGGIACTTCHQENGQGTPGAFPPLVGQKDHMGDCVKHAGIVINGMTGEIVVNDITYNGVMTPQGDLLDDMKIAAVISYERMSWGNDYGFCSPEVVAKARAGAQ